MAQAKTLLKLDAAPPPPKKGGGGPSTQPSKAGLTAANAVAEDILDAILTSKDGNGAPQRVSRTPATKIDVVALQVRRAKWRRTKAEEGVVVTFLLHPLR